MKILFLSLLCLLPSVGRSGSVVRLEVDYEASFLNLASYPQVSIEAGDRARFSITYEATSSPSILEPTRARYDLLGSASLTVGGSTWTASSFEFEIWDNLDVLTPSDEFTFRAQMHNPSEFGMPLSDVYFTFSSFSDDLTFINSLQLPKSEDEFNFSAVEGTGFQVIQPSGIRPIWSISGGGSFDRFEITTIPEPSTSTLMVVIFFSLIAQRRRA